MNSNPDMCYVGGSKGGVGKSLFSFALVNYLLNQERNVLLVDTDTDNPDVYKAHKSLVLPKLFCLMNSLDDADGWADLLGTAQHYPGIPPSSIFLMLISFLNVAKEKYSRLSQYPFGESIYETK
jgi:cellulose biosynthesis protein BcsQ